MTTATLEPETHHAPPVAPPRNILLRAGWIRAAWMSALLFGFGFGVVCAFRWWGGWQPLIDWQPLILVSLLVAAPVGFLAGIGCFDYWVY